MPFAKICNLPKIQHFTARSCTVLKINKKPSLSRLYRECNIYLSPAFVRSILYIHRCICANRDRIGFCYWGSDYFVGQWIQYLSHLHNISIIKKISLKMFNMLTQLKWTNLDIATNEDKAWRIFCSFKEDET